MNEARQSQIMPFVPMYKVIKCSNLEYLWLFLPTWSEYLQRSVCYRVVRASETPSNFVYLFVVFFSYQTNWPQIYCSLSEIRLYCVSTSKVILFIIFYERDLLYCAFYTTACTKFLVSFVIPTLCQRFIRNLSVKIRGLLLLILEILDLTNWQTGNGLNVND